MKIIDQLYSEFIFNEVPQKVISLVPSQTELLAFLGLDESVIGITKFCIHPESWFKTKSRVGGTKKVNIDVINSLKPDLIIGNLEENEKSDIETLRMEYPVWMSDVKTLNDSYDMILKLGRIFNKERLAGDLLSELKEKFSSLKLLIDNRYIYKAAYLIWQDPLMVAASNTFIDSMLGKAGFFNVFSSYQRYPVVSTNDLHEAAPDCIFLSSEPYPFGRKHVQYFQNLCPNSKVIFVDGELFSWYGSRLLKSPEYFLSLHQILNSQ